jgi:hypothetical protein
MTIFSNWRPLSSYPITQSENGLYHRNLIYAGVKQNPLDFGGQVVGYPLTLDRACTVIARSGSHGNYITVAPDFTNYHICFVHVSGHATRKRGDRIPAGEPICRIASQWENGGYAPHLHICSLIWANGKYSQSWIRNVVFKPVGKDIHKNMFVRFTHRTNVRQGNGLQYPILSTTNVGAIARIKDGPRTGNGYRWFDCDFSVGGGGSGWCIDNYMIPQG